jgi:hypothetical protein
MYSLLTLKLFAGRPVEHFPLRRTAGIVTVGLEAKPARLGLAAADRIFTGQDLSLEELVAPTQGGSRRGW